MNKLTIFIDMDGVLANFDKAADEHPDNGIKSFRPDLTLDFSKFEIMPGAKEAVKNYLRWGMTYSLQQLHLGTIQTLGDKKDTGLKRIFQH